MDLIILFLELNNIPYTIIKPSYIKFNNVLYSDIDKCIYDRRSNKRIGDIRDYINIYIQ